MDLTPEDREHLVRSARNFIDQANKLDDEGWPAKMHPSHRTHIEETRDFAE